MALLEVGRLLVERGGRPVVNGVDLELDEGRVLAILGPNGAGKTTLLESVAGIAPEVDGSVRLDGREIGRLPAHDRARLGLRLVGQGRQVIPELSLGQNLELAALGAGLARVPGGALRLFPQLESRSGLAAGQLSGGEQQMLALVMGLMASPRVLLLDEPSFGLAPAVVDSLFAALRRLKTDGFALLLSEQHAGRALDLADEVIVLRSGRVALRERVSPANRDRVMTRVVDSYVGKGGPRPTGGEDRDVEELISVRLPVRLKRELQVRAQALGVHPGRLIEEALASSLQPTRPKVRRR